MWFILFVLFTCLSFVQPKKPNNQINKRNQPVLALHTPRSLMGFFSILLGQPGPLREGRSLPNPRSLCIHDIPDEGVFDEKAASC